MALRDQSIRTVVEMAGSPGHWRSRREGQESWSHTSTVQGSCLKGANGPVKEGILGSFWDLRVFLFLMSFKHLLSIYFFRNALDPLYHWFLPINKCCRSRIVSKQGSVGDLPTVNSDPCRFEPSTLDSFLPPPSTASLSVHLFSTAGRWAGPTAKLCGKVFYFFKFLFIDF